ncbi:MAG: triosephosphate isomerase [Candidatus Parcubacteria bacterium]|nr:MAG: triosephosphate isomerase [Candidatus Parcubacteria bacterium]
MIFVLNFKTYFKRSKEYLKLIKNLKNSKAEFWLAVNPYFYLNLIKSLKVKKFKGLKIGLQNLGPISEKPQTGETIYDFEGINLADFVLLGHSERYRLGENKEIIKEKIRTLQDKNLKLLIFFSENSYRPKNRFSQVKKQIEENLKEFLAVIKKENYKKIYFVYEPWWAISTEVGKIPSREFLEEFLEWYFEFINFKFKFSFPILYGGSYNSKLAEIYQGLKFNGYVLGKASTDIEELKKIITVR